MKFSEIASRISGISCPVFGVQWTPPTSDVAVAREVVTFLEDRRVLYDPAEVEIAEYCARSVIEIRTFLTSKLAAGGLNDELANELRLMRASCRRFLERTERPHMRDFHVPGLQDWMLNQTLGELRGAFSEPLARIAVKYGLDVEEPLSTILPAGDE